MLWVFLIENILNPLRDNSENLSPEAPEMFLDNPPTQSIDSIRPDIACSWQVTGFKFMNRNRNSVYGGEGVGGNRSYNKI